VVSPTMLKNPNLNLPVLHRHDSGRRMEIGQAYKRSILGAQTGRFTKLSELPAFPPKCSRPAEPISNPSCPLLCAESRRT